MSSSGVHRRLLRTGSTATWRHCTRRNRPNRWRSGISERLMLRVHDTLSELVVHPGLVRVQSAVEMLAAAGPAVAAPPVARSSTWLPMLSTSRIWRPDLSTTCCTPWARSDGQALAVARRCCTLAESQRWSLRSGRASRECDLESRGHLGRFSTIEGRGPDLEGGSRGHRTCGTTSHAPLQCGARP